MLETERYKWIVPLFETENKILYESDGTMWTLHLSYSSESSL